MIDATYGRILHMYNAIKKTILIATSTGLIITLLILVIFREYMYVFAANTFTIPNIVLLILGLCILIPFFFIDRNRGKEIEKFLNKYTVIILSVSLALLLGVRLLVSVEGYFTPGWDAGTILGTTTSLVRGTDIISPEYYSRFPNNLLMIWIYSQIGKLAVLFRINTIGYVLLAFQSVICVSSLLLVFLITRDMTGSIKPAWFAYSLSYLFVGLSPWFMIAYSDATGIVFPLLIIRLYQISKRCQRPLVVLLLRFLIGLLSMASFYIKPQLLIAFIAVIIIDIAGSLNKEPQVPPIGLKRKIFTISANLATTLIGIALFLIIYNCLIVPSIPIAVNPDMRAGVKHYIMMGLNDSTDGVYSDSDYVFSYAYNTNAERDAADMELAIQRLKEYGAIGLFRHLADKHVENYGDGTFGWLVEGGFFNNWSPRTEYGLGKLIRFTISGSGAKLQAFKNTFQMLWLTIMFLIIFIPFSNNFRVTPDTDTLLALSLAVIGLTIFELLFEARARYLFCYAPFYVMLASVGYCNLCHMIRKKSTA